MSKFRSMRAAAAALAVLAAYAADCRAADKGEGIFAEGGFFVGCNYWAKNAGMYMWSQWEPATVEAELAALAANGVTVMRVFPLWSDFQPLTGDCRAGGSYRSFRFRDNRPLRTRLRFSRSSLRQSEPVRVSGLLPTLKEGPFRACG